MHKTILQVTTSTLSKIFARHYFEIMTKYENLKVKNCVWRASKHEKEDVKITRHGNGVRHLSDFEKCDFTPRLRSHSLKFRELLMTNGMHSTAKISIVEPWRWIRRNGVARNASELSNQIWYVFWSRKSVILRVGVAAKFTQAATWKKTQFKFALWNEALGITMPRYWRNTSSQEIAEVGARWVESCKICLIGLRRVCFVIS